MLRTEISLAGAAAFILAWAFLNCLVLALTRRPAIAAALALAAVALLIMLSQLKHAALFMTVMLTRSPRQTLLLAREAVAWGKTPEVLTRDNLAKARAMCEVFHADAPVCEAAA